LRKHGTFLRKHGTFLGKHGTCLGKHGTCLGKHGTCLGKYGAFLEKHGFLGLGLYYICTVWRGGVNFYSNFEIEDECGVFY
jgi:hypothetical protein